MSKALKCDRCGAYFDLPKIDKKTSIITTWGDIADRNLTAYGNGYADDGIFHLCDKCQKMLEAFLSNKADYALFKIRSYKEEVTDD